MVLKDMEQGIIRDFYPDKGEIRTWYTNKEKYYSKDVPNTSNPRKGYLLRDVGYVEKQSVLSTYDFADDGILTITTRYDTNVGVERCWFVTDQVRMRVSSVQCLDGVSMTTYCTEFRCPSDEDIRSIAMQAQSLKANTPAPII